jgi:hypothetical protein
MGKVLLGAAAALTALGMATAGDAASVAIGPSLNFLGFDTASVGDHSGSFVSPGLGAVSWSTGPSSFATNTSLASMYLQPQNDGSMYIFGTTASDATVSWTIPVTSVTIYWGSPDTYNTLSLNNGDSAVGGDVLALTGTSSGDNAGTRWITISSSSTFTGFTAISTQAALEFDMAAVPEPSTWAMMGLGFAGLAFAGFRRRRSAISIV